jgi:hypothetical protein
MSWVDKCPHSLVAMSNRLRFQLGRYVKSSKIFFTGLGLLLSTVYCEAKCLADGAPDGTA